jgi:hypothetical protein
VLFDRQIPREPGMGAVLQQCSFLLLVRIDQISRHTNIVANFMPKAGKEEAAFLAIMNDGVSTPHIK